MLIIDSQMVENIQGKFAGSYMGIRSNGKLGGQNKVPRPEKLQMS